MSLHFDTPHDYHIRPDYQHTELNNTEMPTKMNTIALAALQLGTTFALPTAQSQGYGGPCDSNVADTATYDWVNDNGGSIQGGQSFIGGAIVSGGVSTSLTETYSVSTTITVQTSFQLDIEGELGLDSFVDGHLLIPCRHWKSRRRLLMGHHNWHCSQ